MLIDQLFLCAPAVQRDDSESQSRAEMLQAPLGSCLSGQLSMAREYRLLTELFFLPRSLKAAETKPLHC